MLKSVTKPKMFGRHDASCYSAIGTPATVLKLPFSDGSYQGVHPSAIYFPYGWAGYKFWMLVTGYLGGDNNTENPHIFASQDGIQWIVPDGITNPIEPIPVSPICNMDPELVYDPVLNVLRCYSINSDLGDRYRILHPDMTLDDDVIIHKHATDMVIRIASDNWYGFLGRYKVRYHSADGYIFNEPSGSYSTNLDGGSISPWHLSIFYDQMGDGLYHWLYCWYPTASGNGVTSLYHGTTVNITDNPTNLTLIMSPGTAGWTYYQIYRSCMVNLGSQKRIYISARGTGYSPYEWHIGYIDGLV